MKLGLSWNWRFGLAGLLSFVFVASSCQLLRRHRDNGTCHAAFHVTGRSGLDDANMVLSGSRKWDSSEGPKHDSVAKARRPILLCTGRSFGGFGFYAQMLLFSMLRDLMLVV